jgi:hypothetical protein
MINGIWAMRGRLTSLHSATLIYLTLFGSVSFAAQTDPAIPQPLVEWADAAYPQRFFIKVEAPGEGGNVDLHRETFTASIVLPLRTVNGADNQPAPERVLLMGEDARVQSVLVRPSTTGLGSEVLFRSQPGLRRFCLYIGAVAAPQRTSPVDFIPSESGVEMRGRSAAGDFVATAGNPLTLSRFQKLEESLYDGLGTKQFPTINSPENPFVSVSVDQLGHVQRTQNPQRYAALFEGFLRTPVAGKYTFSIDTPGVAHLVIDGTGVLSLDMPDVDRAPFALKKSVELTAGLHRVVVHYAEVNTANRTNAELARFGIRLHWQPPWTDALMCIPPQAFCKTMPAIITRHEVTGSKAEPYLQVEELARVRCASHLGARGVHEQALLAARLIEASDAVTATVAGRNLPIKTVGTDMFFFCALAGEEVHLAAADKKWERVFTVPLVTREELVDLQGAEEIKSAPDFLYVDEFNHRNDETAHIHIQTALAPPPVIVPKENIEMKFLPPPARPMGEYQLRWQFVSDDAAATQNIPVPAPVQVEATPFENGRRRQRASFTAADLEPLAKAGHWKLVFTLSVGGIDCESTTLRLLHAEKDWPGKMIAGPGDLFFEPARPLPEIPQTLAPEADGTAAFWKYERVLMLVRRQNDADYREFAPLKMFAGLSRGSDALFFGDPLVEGLASGVSKEPAGVAAILSKDTPALKWQYLYVPGPHRYLPVFKMLSELEAFQQSRSGESLPGTIVLSLGPGDPAHQTPIYSFDRALDALLARFKEFGAKRIILVGVIPEVAREAHAEPYQQRVLDLQRQHHVDTVDVFHAWTAEPNWARRYALDGNGANDVSTYGPLPNGEALNEVAKMIEDKLH